MTLLRLTDAACGRDDLRAEARKVLDGGGAFEVRSLRLERFDAAADRWRFVRGFGFAARSRG
ncbi:hypothetical protein [Actinomadura sediminis]|uniref:Uncharacterized protein n=1 Tax=Actinomadura sediminis TaxID=1038904 RepID=A0ABW3EX73_9ACTN